MIIYSHFASTKTSKLIEIYHFFSLLHAFNAEGVHFT